MKMKNDIHKKVGAISILSLVAIGVLYTIYALFFATQGTPLDIVVYDTDDENETVALAQQAGDIEGAAAIVMDVKTKKVYIEKSIRIPLPIASITKVATALVTLTHLEEDDTIQIKAQDIPTIGGARLSIGEIWNVRDLVAYSLITSSNEASNALARTVQEKKNTPFSTLMKAFTQKHNLTQTSFINPSGLDIHEGLAGSTSSAYDIAEMLVLLYTLHPDIAQLTGHSEVAFNPYTNKKHTAVNTNTAIENIDGVKVSKTGYTDLSGGSLAVIVDRGYTNPVVVVVLGSTKNGRFSDVVALIDQFSENSSQRSISIDDSVEVATVNETQ